MWCHVRFSLEPPCAQFFTVFNLIVWIAFWVQDRIRNVHRQKLACVTPPTPWILTISHSSVENQFLIDYQFNTSNTYIKTSVLWKPNMQWCECSRFISVQLNIHSCLTRLNLVQSLSSDSVRDGRKSHFTYLVFEQNNQTCHLWAATMWSWLPVAVQKWFHHHH